MTGFVGVDLGATNLRGWVVDASGEERGRDRLPVGEDPSPAAVVDRIAELADRLLESAGLASLAGLCVGVAGWLDEASGLVHNGPNLGWRDVPFGRLLQARLRGPARVVNDLSAVTWGEWRAGAGQGAEHLLCVFLGSGLGAGLVLHGRLYGGASGLAGELGHIPVQPGGRACGCGRNGCLEAYVGGHNVEARLREEASEGRHVAALRAAGDPSALTCAHAEQAAAAGDPDAARLWDEVAGWLAMGLTTGIQLLNPDHLILGGGVLDGCPDLRRRTLDSLEAQCPASMLEPTRVVPSTLGGWAGAVGAALLARQS